MEKINFEIESEQNLEDELYFANKSCIRLLTKRQLECLTLCAHGFSNNEISKTNSRRNI